MSDRSIEFIARGLVIRDGLVLLCKNVKHGYYFLPGGHVEFGETAQTALVREFKEETGITITCRSAALVAEHIFERRKGPCHELNIVFHVELPEVMVVSLESKIAFEWTDLAQLSDLDLRPACIKAWLLVGGRTSCHVTWASEQTFHGEH